MADTPTASPTHFLYCDEAGHTGANFLDPAQPVYVSAGWFVEAAVRDQARSCLGRSTELKAATAVKSPRGQRELVGVFDALVKLGARPFFVVTEKRYALAERVLETLLDPVSNPEAAGLARGFAARQALLDIFYALPDGPLNMFGDAYRQPDEVRVATAVVAVADHLGAHSHGRLAAMIRPLASRPGELIDDELGAVEGFDHRQLRSPNMPTFEHLLGFVDRYAIARSAGRVHVVHDEQFQFRGVMAFYQRTLGAVGGLGGLGLELVEGFETVDSQQEALVQAADYLATTVARLTLHALAGTDWTPELTTLAKRTLLGLLVEPPLMGGIFCHPSLAERLRGRLQPLASSAI